MVQVLVYSRKEGVNGLGQRRKVKIWKSKTTIPNAAKNTVSDEAIQPLNHFFESEHLSTIILLTNIFSISKNPWGKQRFPIPSEHILGLMHTVSIKKH